MQKNRHKTKKGFTIIELVLAMGFLSTILLTIAILLIQIMSIYQKGLSLRAVNSVGQQLIDELMRTVGGSPIVTGINPEPDASGIINEQAITAALRKYYVSNTITEDGEEKQINGVFCTGSYSYIWNTPESDPTNLNSPNILTVQYGETGPRVAYKLARVVDPARNICQEARAENPAKNFVISESNPAPIELINSDEADLYLYDFTVFPATQNTITGQTFYSATFILGTMRGGINIMSSGDYCEDLASVEMTSDFDYCAVNKFNFAMRATGYTEGEDQYGERGD